MKPTIGRIVHFFPPATDGVARSNSNDGPIAAIVVRVWSDDVLNLTICPDNAVPASRSSIGRRGSESDRGWGSWDWPAREPEAAVVTGVQADPPAETKHPLAG